MDFVRTQISSVMSCMQKHPRIAALTAAGAAVSLVGFAALSGVFQKKWEVHDKVVLITGASSGMGKELALQLVGMGARVSLVARRKDELQAVVDECNKRQKDSAIGTVGDVSIRSDNAAFVEATVQHFGRLDVLILNAGISAGAPMAEVTEKGLDSFEMIQKINYFGPVYATKYALPHLLKSIGKIVVISSVFGVHGGPGRTFYAGSKYALHGFYDSLRMEMELDKTGVTVTMVCPGAVATDIWKSRVGPDGHRATTGNFDLSQALHVEKASEYIIDAFQRSQRMRGFALSTHMLHRFGNIVPSFWDFLFIRGMRKLGMLIDTKKTEGTAE